MNGPIDPSPVRTAFDQFGMEARIEARMLDQDKPITEEQRQLVVRELLAYRENHRNAKGRPMPWEDLGGLVGVSGSTLNEITTGRYKADPANVLRQIDQFLADERIKLGRFDVRSFAHISLTHKIKGAIESGLKRNTMPVIIGEPGSSKSQHARWWVGQREGAILIEPDDFDCDERWAVDAIYAALGANVYQRNRRDKKRWIVSYLRKHKATVIVIDEAQKLSRGALEMLRRLHDLSDPTGRRNVSIVFFGDEDFYKLIVQARGGARVSLSPQFTRRVYPVFDIARNGCELDRSGAPKAGTVFKRADIEAITRNQRVRVLREDAVDWLVRLANLSGHGSLGIAMLVMETAWDLREGKLVTVDDLQLALSTVLGPEEVDAVDEQAGNTLLAKVG